MLSQRLCLLTRRTFGDPAADATLVVADAAANSSVGGPAADATLVVADAAAKSLALLVARLLTPRLASAVVADAAANSSAGPGN